MEDILKHSELIELLNEIAQKDLSDESDISDHPCSIAISELEAARNEAAMLATALWKQYYKDEAPDWGLCDTPAGIITQIDNMTTGLVKG